MSDTASAASDAPAVPLETIRDALDRAIGEKGFRDLVPGGEKLRAVIYQHPIRGHRGVTFAGALPSDRVEDFIAQMTPVIQGFTGRWMYPFVRLAGPVAGSTEFVASGP